MSLILREVRASAGGCNFCPSIVAAFEMLSSNQNGTLRARVCRECAAHLREQLTFYYRKRQRAVR